jgi:hypothetical protein
MERFPPGDQVARFDREATGLAYEQLASAGFEQYRCARCRSFIAQRESVHPVGKLHFLLL